jgi:hypothetical protein
MGKEYKIRMPVMQRLCAHCQLDFAAHIDGKCLFDSSSYKPGKMKTERKTVKAKVTTTDFCCGRTQHDRCAKCGRDFNS